MPSMKLKLVKMFAESKAQSRKISLGLKKLMTG